MRQAALAFLLSSFLASAAAPQIVPPKTLGLLQRQRSTRFRLPAHCLSRHHPADRRCKRRHSRDLQGARLCRSRGPATS